MPKFTTEELTAAHSVMFRVAGYVHSPRTPKWVLDLPGDDAPYAWAFGKVDTGPFTSWRRLQAAAEAATRLNERRLRKKLERPNPGKAPMRTLRRNSATSLNQEEMRLHLLDALYHLREAQKEAREGRLFVASGTLRSVGMKLAFLFAPENRAYITEMTPDMDEFISVIRDIRDSFGQAQYGILYGTTPKVGGVNSMVGSITTLMGDIESIYTVLFNARPPRS